MTPSPWFLVSSRALPALCWGVGLALLVGLVPVAAGSQANDSTARRLAADSARFDSLRIADAPARGGSDRASARPGTAAGSQGPSNPRLIPNLSAVGDLIGDLSPRGSTEEDGSRFGIREVEVAIQAAVDPYFRGDIFLGLSDVERVSIEQAYLTASALPWGVELRLGRFLMPFGKENTTHRHDLHTFEYPHVLQRLLDPEGLKGTGIYASKVLSPLGFYQEIIGTVIDRVAEANEALVADEPANTQLTGLGYSLRLRNYWDLTQHANLEFSGSIMTGRREQPLDGTVSGAVNAVNARQTTYGADVTFRWRPLQQGLYRSLLVRGEALRQANERVDDLDDTGESSITYAGPRRDFTGFYTFARWQVSRRGFLEGRLDLLQDPERDGATTRALSAYLQFYPSEFSKLVAGYERLRPGATDLRATDRIILQATFALGPHRPHPF